MKLTKILTLIIKLSIKIKNPLQGQKKKLNLSVLIHNIYGTL